MANKLKVELTDFASGCNVSSKDYVPHKDVTLKALPDKVDRLEVSVDNGRLLISINGELAFYSSSLTDGSVEIFK